MKKPWLLISCILFVACIVGANMALDKWGLITLPIIGMTAPAGVYFAGAVFGLRDAVQETGGYKYVMALIAIGTVVSLWMSDTASIPGGHTSIAIASGVAFALSELADFSVYSPLRRRHWPTAVVASNLIGSILDSILFLWLAFGSIEYMWGQVAGKTIMIIPALLVVRVCRRG